MNSAVSRRMAIKGAAGGLVAVAVGAAAGPARAVAAGAELLWNATGPFGVTWDMTSRVVSRLPTSARYGSPISLGPVTVQATVPDYMVAHLRQYTLVSCVGEGSLTAVDSRGLTAHFLVGLTFPRTPLPDTDRDFTLTGTAVITSPLPLPLPRNRGPMRIELDPTAYAEWTGWYADGQNDGPIGVLLELADQPPQNRTVATIDIR